MKIYLAGAEQSDSYDLIRQGLIENAFLSYYYLRGKTKPELMQFFRDNLKSIIVDSGAHTFFSETESMKVTAQVRKKTKTKDSPEDFFQGFKKWLVENYKYIDYYAELDIGELVGQKKVVEWREELKEAGVYDKCITVYHPSVMSIKDFDDMLDDSQSKFVAFEGFRGGRRNFDYLPLLKKCYEKGIKVHGFAMTKDKVLDVYPFYSADSTSWKAGVQYGTAKVMTTRGIKNINFKNKDKLFTVKGTNLIDVHNENKKIARDRTLELSIEAYKQMEDKYTRLWEARGIKW